MDKGTEGLDERQSPVVSKNSSPVRSPESPAFFFGSSLPVATVLSHHKRCYQDVAKLIPKHQFGVEKCAS